MNFSVLQQTRTAFRRLLNKFKYFMRNAEASNSSVDVPLVYLECFPHST